MGYPKGFSLIEMIVSILVLSIVGMMAFSFLGNSMAAYMNVKNSDRIFEEGLMALERMTREIRDARAGSAITVVSNTSITFTRKHATPQDASTTITFQRNGSQLERVGDVSGARELAGNVTSFNPVLSGSNVDLSLGLTRAGGGAITLSSSATARN